MCGCPASSLPQCWPYHYEDSVLILGDAAHAMVPFYGQGMNAGFQDVLVLDRILDETQGDLSKALATYSARRHPDAIAICDLAMYNYVEMRSKARRHRPRGKETAVTRTDHLFAGRSLLAAEGT